MLLRILIASHDLPLNHRLVSLLEGVGDLLTTSLVDGENLWDRLRRDVCDLVILEAALLGDGLCRALADIRALPDAPEVVVVSEIGDPVYRAELLAAKAYAIVSPDVSKLELTEALRAIVVRRTEQAHPSRPRTTIA